MRGTTSEYGPILFCALIVAAALLDTGCARSARPDPTPKERAQNALYVSAEFVKASAQTVNAAYESGICDDQIRACSAADDAIIGAVESLNVAEAQLTAWSGADEKLPCFVDSLAHLAAAIRDINGIDVPEQFESVLEVTSFFQAHCFPRLQ